MIDNTTIKLNEKSVENNISFLKSIYGDKVTISAVVKADAYGHGIEQIVPIFQKFGINHFSVFYYSEALRVYNSLSKPNSIMVMGWLSYENIKDAIKKRIEFFVFNLERLKNAIEFAKELHLKAKIHLEVETGMNRSGLNTDEFDTALEMIKENIENIEISGFCTHLAGAESISNDYRIKNQMLKFDEIFAKFEASNLHANYRHIANSAASFVYPESRMDLVRVGIMLYGFWSSTEVFIKFINNKENKTDPLKRVLSWSSQIMAIKKVKTGEFIGYGISYLAQNDITTAIVPVGYSMGYSRALSNKGRVLIRGHRCPVIGVVNMNMIIINITNVKNAEVGDEVVLIGKQKKLEIKVSSFGDLSDELNYEVLAHLPEDIIRKVVKK